MNYNPNAIKAQINLLQPRLSLLKHHHDVAETEKHLIMLFSHVVSRTSIVELTVRATTLLKNVSTRPMDTKLQLLSEIEWGAQMPTVIHKMQALLDNLSRVLLSLL